MTATCPRCGHDGPHVQGPGTAVHHARLFCGRCERFLRFLPKPGNESKRDPGSWEWAHPARARMRDLPPSEAQLELIGRSEWRWMTPHLRDRDMASKLVSWIVAEGEA